MAPTAPPSLFELAAPVLRNSRWPLFGRLLYHISLWERAVDVFSRGSAQRVRDVGLYRTLTTGTPKTHVVRYVHCIDRVHVLFVKKLLTSFTYNDEACEFTNL